MHALVLDIFMNTTNIIFFRLIAIITNVKIVFSFFFLRFSFSYSSLVQDSMLITCLVLLMGSVVFSVLMMI